LEKKFTLGVTINVQSNSNQKDANKTNQGVYQIASNLTQHAYQIARRFRKMV
jgi:hypothetical protein